MLDFHTGYLRAIAENATVCSNATDTYGDGCPAIHTSFGTGSGGGLGVGADALGNVYISDSKTYLIRKVITGLAMPSTTVAATTAQSVKLHFIAGDTAASSNALEWAWMKGASTINQSGVCGTLGTPDPAPAPAADGQTLTVSSTGYSLPGHTSSGIPVGWGVVAVDPTVIPLGTRLTIPGYGEGVAADTGSAVRGADIDLWFPTLTQARAWGRRTITITLHS